jgi:hypothetical protein
MERRVSFSRMPISTDKMERNPSINPAVMSAAKVHQSTRKPEPVSQSAGVDDQQSNIVGTN